MSAKLFIFSARAQFFPLLHLLTHTSLHDRETSRLHPRLTLTKTATTTVAPLSLRKAGRTKPSINFTTRFRVVIPLCHGVWLSSKRYYAAKQRLLFVQIAAYLCLSDLSISSWGDSHGMTQSDYCVFGRHCPFPFFLQTVSHLSLFAAH